MAAARAARVVITHDFMETYGGAERVTEEIAKAFPQAPVYALLGRDEIAERMGVADRFESLLPQRAWLFRGYRLLAPFYAPWADRVRLPDADVVVASSYAYAHRLRSSNEHAPIVCYCHSPLRFAWSMTASYRERWAPDGLRARAFEALAATTRRSDRRAARRIVSYLTQSPFTAEQIEGFYGRKVAVIGAPVDCDKFVPSSRSAGDFFLLVARLVEPYKRVGVAVEAFRRLGLPLKVAGTGPAFDELSAAAPANVEFLGHLADDELVPLMQTCQAAIFPSRDDFGLVPLEVMACGRPVLAYAGGGARYTVAPGVTGELFAEQTADSVEAAVRAFDPDAYEPRTIREHALLWDKRRFRERLVEAVAVALDGEPIGDRRVEDDRRRADRRRGAPAAGGRGRRERRRQDRRFLIRRWRER
jgi:glycosyltransferase involved in cell wall biosynthesis